jgi:hypothetical protein
METCANLQTFSFPNAMQCALHDARTRQDAVAENIMAQVCQDLTPQKIYTLPTFRLMTKDQKGIGRLRVYIEYSIGILVYVGSLHVLLHCNGCIAMVALQ